MNHFQCSLTLIFWAITDANLSIHASLAAFADRVPDTRPALTARRLPWWGVGVSDEVLDLAMVTSFTSLKLVVSNFGR